MNGFSGPSCNFGVIALLPTSEANLLKTERYYRDRAVYMRRLANDAVTEKLRDSCLNSAEQFESLAKVAAESEAKAQPDDKN
jgi:hypothetical protein